VLSKIPEPEFKRSEPRGGFRQMVKEALRDRNFTKLIFFYVAWTFASGIAGPFYAVFMIKNLSLSFSFIAFLGILTSIIYLLTLRPWGIISDRFGNRPIMLVTGVAIGIIPFLWLLATPQNYSILLFIHLLAGFVGAGATLTHFNIKLKLTPEENRPVYLALSVVPCGIAGFISTSAGGYIARALQNFHFKFLFLSLCNYNLLFILSGFFVLTSLFLLQKVHEPKAVSAPQIVTIIRETKELNPIYSLGWAIDYTAFSLRQSRTILHRLDRESEKLAARSENFIGRLIYRGEKWLQRKIHFFSNTKKGG
jgi:MFS family permease